MPETRTWSIKTRRLVADRTVAPGTVHISEGRVSHISRQDDAPPSASELDVGDLVVMPGVVDTHVHINEPGRTDWEGFVSAGRAAAAGGVTTMVVMPLNCSPSATNIRALMGEATAARGACLVDYGFWGGLIPGNTSDLGPLWESGVLGFKCFMSPSGIDDFPNVAEADLDSGLATLKKLARSGHSPVLLVHAEDPALIADAERALPQTSGRSYSEYLRSRPAAAEVQAIRTLVRLCERHRARIHVVHVAAAEALPLIADAKRAGLGMSAETCPHYLAFDQESIPDGATQFKCAPPIRARTTRDALWDGLRAGVLDLIASDHSPCPPELKHLDSGDFMRAWGGISSLQLSLPVIWTEAQKRGFGLSDVSEWLSAGPARLAGIDPIKGTIQPGSDADLVIWDPDASWTVRGTDLEHRHKVTPYDGAVVRGVVHATFVRGKRVFGREGCSGTDTTARPVFATEAFGQWVKRTNG